jgi:hypothetical protein
MCIARGEASLRAEPLVNALKRFFRAFDLIRSSSKRGRATVSMFHYVANSSSD